MIKTMNIKEFRDEGYLQELNRQFLHPLGLALAIQIDAEGDEMEAYVWDSREDDEGILYHESIINGKDYKEKKKNIENIQKQKFEKRMEQLGYVIQE